MRNRGFYRSLAAILVVGLSFTGMARGASLQFIVCCDTIDPGIGTAHDLALCSNWAQIIANQTGLTLNLQTLSGTDLTPANARNLLNALHPAADDVIYFVYSGHGANPGSGPWPMFTLLTDLSDPVTFDEVVAILQPKSQRALFVMSDCCNVPMEAPARMRPPVEASGSPALTTANYQRLFVDFRGTVLATSSAAGQYSLSDPVLDGGLFLYTFVNDLNALAANTTELTWDSVLRTTAAEATRKAETWLAGEEDIQPQQAYYTIGGEQVAPSTPTPPTSNQATTEEVADATPETGTPAAGNCGAMGAGPLMMIALGCFALKARRHVTRV
jgi:hypothetical protein